MQCKNIKEAKASARAMRKWLSEQGVTMSHAKCLEGIARLTGQASWNSLSASFAEAPLPPVSVTGLARMSFDEWEAQFKPQANPFNPEGSDGGTRYETFGSEEAEVRQMAQKFPRRVWTLLDTGDGRQCIGEGIHFVNRVGYFITEVPAVPGTEYEIPYDYDMDDREFRVTFMAVGDSGGHIPVGFTTVFAGDRNEALTLGKEKLEQEWDSRLDAASCRQEWLVEEIG